jgi:hydroxymethylpyrimidine/phosphomethylpyrimidine kinase
VHPPVVLTLAGSDSSGGAGIQADLKAISACGGYGASVLTAITAQNTRGVTAADGVALPLVRAQIDAVFADLDVAACKTGMLATCEIVLEVAAGLTRHAARRYVCDPVMISKSGFALLGDDCIDAVIEELLPRAALVTPNTHEAERLTGIKVRTLADAERAGRRILEHGARAVLVKGGHLPDRPGADVLVIPGGAVTIEGEWIETANTHGTGCTYAAAIATHLARGFALEDAVRRSKRFLTEAIRAGWALGGGHGPTDPFFFLRDDAKESGLRTKWIDELTERPA